MLRLVEGGRGNESKGRVMILMGPVRWKALKLSDITHVEAKNAESRFHTADGDCYRSHRSLADVESVLESHGFRRCHRSFLINLDYIDEVVRRGARNKDIILKVEGDVRIPLQRDWIGIKEDFCWI